MTCFKLPMNARCATLANVRDRSSRSSMTWTAALPGPIAPAGGPSDGSCATAARYNSVSRSRSRPGWTSAAENGGSCAAIAPRAEQVTEIRNPQVGGSQRVRRRPVPCGRQTIAQSVKPHCPKLITTPELLGDSMDPHHRRHIRVVARRNLDRYPSAARCSESWGAAKVGPKLGAMGGREFTQVLRPF